MEAIQSSITAGASGLTQAAVTAAVTDDSDYEKELIADFRNRRDKAYELLQAIDWMSCIKPASGPYFWCDITKLTKNTSEFCVRLLAEKKVAVMQGEAFGTPGFIRIAFNATPLEDILQAITDLKSFGDTYKE
jgi:aspartate aminotransferase